MLVAACFSLLSPAVDLARTWKMNSWLIMLLVCLSFVFGAGVLMLAKRLIRYAGLTEDPLPVTDIEATKDSNSTNATVPKDHQQENGHMDTTVSYRPRSGSIISADRSCSSSKQTLSQASSRQEIEDENLRKEGKTRAMMLAFAMVLHGIPEGLGMGIAYKSIGLTPGATLQSAVSLTVGIALHSMFEGLIVSLPLVGAGCNRALAFFLGQLGGAFHPLSAALAALAAHAVESVMPWILSFGGGAVIYVVVDDLIPEAHKVSGPVATAAAITGFLFMLTMKNAFEH